MYKTAVSRTGRSQAREGRAAHSLHSILAALWGGVLTVHGCWMVEALCWSSGRGGGGAEGCCMPVLSGGWMGAHNSFAVSHGLMGVIVICHESHICHEP